MNLLACLIQFFTGVQARWVGCKPEARQRVYFANHTSHFDFLVLWSVLPVQLRENTAAVGAADYWTKGHVRRWLTEKVFHIILVERENVTRKNNPLDTLTLALDQGKSLIFFPEGGRCSEDERKPFKCGMYHLAKARPDLEFVPTYIHNANRVLPKGEALPIPVICSTTFGPPIHMLAHEPKKEFLERAQCALRQCAEL
jgi:1-acyl-sn-glycerol-3-phosphate acyltransferase